MVRTFLRPNPVHNENGEPIPFNIQYAVQWTVAKHLKPSGYQDKGYQFERAWRRSENRTWFSDCEPAWSIFKCLLDSHYRVKICLAPPWVGMIAEPRRLFENWEHRHGICQFH